MLRAGTVAAFLSNILVMAYNPVYDEDPRKAGQIPNPKIKYTKPLGFVASVI
jgi:hypothetical protein